MFSRHSRRCLRCQIVSSSTGPFPHADTCLPKHGLRRWHLQPRTTSGKVDKRPNNLPQSIVSLKMGCSGSKATEAEVQKTPSSTLLDSATAKPASAFDLTNGDQIKATLAKVTVDELSTLMQGWSPEVRSKLEAGLQLEAKQQAEKATFDLTNSNEIKATLAKLTVDELSTLMKGWSPEVRSKLEAGLEVEAKRQAEKATAKAAPAAGAEDGQTEENAKADTPAVETPTAPTEPETEELSADVTSKSLCCF